MSGAGIRVAVEMWLRELERFRFLVKVPTILFLDLERKSQRDGLVINVKKIVLWRM
jgi:hypothetical protein